ncbi:MAG: HD domain-containing protein [Syntrophomonas sp.]|nr:HD domain-containing protein [Syntrophomonas sp.]
MVITLESLKKNDLITKYMQMGNDYIGNMGALEHSLHHAEYISGLCYEILDTLGYSKREAELGAMAGYLHDIGNLVNRYGHGMSGALIAFNVLMEMGMEPEEVAVIIGAIGNHEEHANGKPVNNVAAAVIVTDKSDVHRSRVRKDDFSLFTARDRVNYAVTKSSIKADAEEKTITLKLEIDTSVCSVMEYFEIFLTKMLMCRHAAEHLQCELKIMINEIRLL